MTPGRWRQLEQLYDAVVNLPAAERSLRLQDADPELRSAIEAILAKDGSALEHPGWERHASLLETVTVVWIVDAERGLPRRLTSDARMDNYPIWSPDGRTVVFSDTRDLFRMAVTGTGGQALVLSGTNLRIVTDWSRDGSTIFYYERFPAATKSDLGTLAVTADGKMKDGAKPRLYLSTPADESWTRFSPEPNPRWAAYQSDASGKNEVYIDTFPER